MPPFRLAHPTASLGARVLPAVAAIAAMAAFGAFPAAATGGAESLYLAFAAGVVLLSAAAVAPAPGLAAAAGALAATLAAWALPGGPARGAVVTAVAAGALAVAASRRFGTDGRDAAEGSSLPVRGVVGLALGTQALLRGSELLGAGSPLRAAAIFVGFPVAGALAVLALAPVFGRRPALLAGGAAILVAPGFRPASVAALAALAAGSWLFHEGLSREGRRWPLPRHPRDDGGRSLVVLLLLLAPFAWDVRAAGLGLAAGLVAGALALPGTGAESPEGTSGGARRWLAPALAAAALALLGLAPGRPPAEVAALVSLVVLAVPALLLVDPRRAPGALAALLLALAAARGVRVEGFLAGPVALAALAALATPRGVRVSPFREAVPAVQGAWSAVALGLAGLLGAYPWLRPDPFGELLPRFGLAARPASALLAVLALAAVAALASLGAGWLRSRGSEDERTGRPALGAGTVAGRVALAALAAVLLLHLPPAGSAAIGRQPVVLDAGRPAWTAPIPPGDPGDASGAVVVVDSSLANSVGLEPGTPVATVRWRRAGAPDRSWVLRAGRETGEWAAGRPDLAAAATVAPDPWQSWVAEEGGFFGQRYRAARRLGPAGYGEAPGEAGRAEIAVELRDDLPEEVTLTLFHLEVRP